MGPGSGHSLVGLLSIEYVRVGRSNSGLPGNPTQFSFSSVRQYNFSTYNKDVADAAACCAAEHGLFLRL